MKCVECGKGRMRMRLARVPHQIRGLSFAVEDKVNVCDSCGFITIPLERADEHGNLVDQEYRRLAGILTADQIREARHRLRMSQREFADYLGVGEASVKRWETGVLPDKSSSDLIRLKTDLEEARRNYDALCRRLNLRQPENVRLVISKPVFFPQRTYAWLNEPFYDAPLSHPTQIQ